ncbi:MAG: hypothetical protein WD426_00485 [Anditalea sp.]
MFFCVLLAIYYKMVKYQQRFNPMNLGDYQQKYRQAKIAYLERKLTELKRDVA